MCDLTSPYMNNIIKIVALILFADDTFLVSSYVYAFKCQSTMNNSFTE